MEGRQALCPPAVESPVGIGTLVQQQLEARKVALTSSLEDSR